MLDFHIKCEMHATNVTWTKRLWTSA